MCILPKNKVKSVTTMYHIIPKYLTSFDFCQAEVQQANSIEFDLS